MAPAALPLSKLAGLLIKTLSKPMAKQIKSQMTKRPLTRSALISVGQTTHAITTRMTVWSAGYRIRSISRLEDDVALSRGADLLSEIFIFSVSGAIVVYEYNRSSEKEKKKEAARLQKIRDEATSLQAKLDSLDARLVALEEYAQANRRSIVLGIGVGANGEYVKPKSVVPISEGESSVVNNAEFYEDRSNQNEGSPRPTEKVSAKPAGGDQGSSWWRLWPFR